MRINYTPTDTADGDPHAWDFDPKRVRASEVARVEDLYGQTWPMFVQDVQKQSAKALRLLLWHLMRRDHPDSNLKLGDVPDFYIGEVEVQLSSVELRSFLDAIKASAMNETEKQQLLDQGELEYTAAVAREAARGEAPTPPLPIPSPKSEAAIG